MKNLIAPLLGLLMATACGGEQDQSQVPQSPQTPPEAPAATTTTTTETTTTTDTPTATETATPVPQSELAKDTLRSLTAAFNEGDARRIGLLYTPDAVVAGLGPNGWTEETGRPLVEASYGRVFNALPDARMAVSRIHLADDVAIQEWVLTGTHKGTLGDVAPTNRQIGVQGASVFELDDEGRIRAERTYYDALAIGAQLGTHKGKARPIAAAPTGEPRIVEATGKSEDNRWLDAARAFYEAHEKLDEKAFLAVIAADATRTSYMDPEDRKGTKAVVEDFRIFIKAFPETEIETRNLWGFGDHVVAENVIKTSRAGAWGGARGTQKPATLHTLDVLTFDDEGKITEIVTYGSALELMLQAGQDTKQPRPFLRSGGGQGQSPGQQGTTPGQQGTTPGQQGTTPGQQGTTPGQGQTPGQGPR